MPLKDESCAVVVICVKIWLYWETRVARAFCDTGSGTAATTAPAVAPVGDRVVLLADGPEAVQPGEGELGARHLHQLPAARTELLDDRGVDPRADRSSGHLGVLVEQTVSYERDLGHGVKSGSVWICLVIYQPACASTVAGSSDSEGAAFSSRRV